MSMLSKDQFGINSKSSEFPSVSAFEEATISQKPRTVNCVNNAIIKAAPFFWVSKQASKKWIAIVVLRFPLPLSTFVLGRLFIHIHDGDEQKRYPSKGVPARTNGTLATMQFGSVVRTYARTFLLILLNFVCMTNCFKCWESAQQIPHCRRIALLASCFRILRHAMLYACTISAVCTLQIARGALYQASCEHHFTHARPPLFFAVPLVCKVCMQRCTPNLILVNWNSFYECFSGWFLACELTRKWWRWYCSTKWTRKIKAIKDKNIFPWANRA